jgi:glutamate-1-semialdehyde 2,1-aminomutase
MTIKTTKYSAVSESLFQKSKNVFAGVGNSPHPEYANESFFLERGSGSRLYDTDGKEYVDMLSMGSLILGHANQKVIEAVSKAIRDGLPCGTCHKKENELAEIILSGLPEFDSIRFLNSTADASLTAIKQAKLFTRRNLIVRFAGGPGSEPNNDCLSNEIITAGYDDEDAFESVIKKYSDRIAAVYIDPLPANYGLLVQRKEFLKFVRELTWRNGSLLIFDEMNSSFRIHFGGYYHLLNIVPDIVVLGNIIGNGMSLGVIAGLDSVMRLLTANGYSGDLSYANPIALYAGIAVLDQLTSGDIYGKLDSLGRKFALLLKESKIPYANFQQVGSILWPHLDTGELPRIPQRISPVSVKRFNSIHCGMIKRGFFISSSAYDPIFLSSTHSEEDIECFVAAIIDELTQMESV